MEESIITLEHEIAVIIGKDNGNTVHFSYEIDHSRNLTKGDIGATYSMVASAYTVNQSSRETFLLKSASGLTREDALREILSYVKSIKDTSTFAVVWSRKGTLKAQTSYFYCDSAKEALDKFFTNKEVPDYIIYELRLKPVS